MKNTKKDIDEDNYETYIDYQQELLLAWDDPKDELIHPILLLKTRKEKVAYYKKYCVDEAVLQPFLVARPSPSSAPAPSS